MLEPDGQKSHWLRIDANLLDASGARIGDIAHFEIMAVQEPEPEVPDDLAQALTSAPEARATWDATTTGCPRRLDSLDHFSETGKDPDQANQ
jgi:hypothetical protein